MTLRPWLVAGSLALLAVCGCRPAQEEASVTHPAKLVYAVMKGGREVLLLKEGPGPITSRAALPPGAAPAVHPFVSAAALDPNEEDSLRGLLDQSSGFADYLERLRKAGYQVHKTDQQF